MIGSKSLWSRVGAAGLVLLLSGLAWQIILDAGVGHALEVGSAKALLWRSSDSRALAAAADRQLILAKGDSDFAYAAVLARRALIAGPTEIRALRDIGVALAAQGHADLADVPLSLAARRSLHDGPSHMWALDRALRQGRLATAFQEADVLLRDNPERLPTLSPALVAAAEAHGGQQAAADPLAAAPSWREPFLLVFAEKAKAPDHVFSVLQALQETSKQPTPVEVKAYLDRRIRGGEFDQAYLDWLQLLPKPALQRLGNVYDGDFAGAAGSAPFNWVLGSGLGGLADMGPSPSGTKRTALHVQYDGVSDPQLASQLLALPAGVWRLTGQTWSATNTSVSLSWKVVCADDAGHVLAKVRPAVEAGRWNTFAIDFTAPPSGCSGQWLRLAPEPGDRQQPLELWFTGITLTRVGL